MVQFTDRLTIDRSHKTSDGYLRVTAKATRTGVQQYSGREVDPEGKHFTADQVVNVYRPADEVFEPTAVASFIGRPITDDHPAVAVTAKNWRDHSRGVVGGAVRDGDWLGFDLALMDADLVEKVDGGKRELSAGYSCDLAIEDGKAPDGTAYQAVQRTIRGNHVAVVDKARAGSDARISDGGNKLFECCDAATVILNVLDEQREKPVSKITLDGLQVDLSDADAVKAAIGKIQGQLADANKAKDAAETALVDAKRDHDRALAAKDTEIDGLKGKIVDQAQIDALADAKATVVGKAKAVLGDKLPDTAGKSVADVRRMTVAAKLGDAAVADKSDDYVEARFDGLTGDSADSTVRPIHQPTVIGDAASLRDKAFNEAADRERNAWKTKQAAA